MAAAATSDVADGPVINVINKRLRALRKKSKRIAQMEEALSQGKLLNKEQEEFLRSKPGVVALIDELEKLRPPISAAVQEEVSLAIALSSAPATTTSTATTITDEKENSDSADGDTAVSEKEQEQEQNSVPGFIDGIVEDVLKLIYFGFIFDLKSQSDFTSMILTRTHERNCCLTYDYVTDDETDLLGEKDLDIISATSNLLVSRPVDSPFSHKNALRRCVEHAKLWIAKSDQYIEAEPTITYAGLRERLDKIMASDYFTTSPEMKAPVEVAAAAGNYASFHAAVVPPSQVESPVEQYHQDEATADFQQVHEINDNQSNPMEDVHEDDFETENAVEVTSPQEQAKPSEEGQNQRDVDPKEQQYIPRRNYPNHRGGGGGGHGGNASGRRGYPNGRSGRGNGRGGGGYQNGHNQYYEQQQQQQQQQQPGNYYQRNYYNNRGRGGRGGGGGGRSYNNYGDVEAAS